jgi:hypothetical protein
VAGISDSYKLASVSWAMIVALLDFVGSATEVATIMTEAVAGMIPGAVYAIATPLREFWLEIVPQPGACGSILCKRPGNSFRGAVTEHRCRSL